MIRTMTIYPAKILAGILAGFLSVFVRNLLPLFVTVTVFELVDFLTGVIKSAVVAKRSNQKFAFESVKAWRTIYKYVLILIGIVLAEMLDHTIATETRLRFANYFTAFCCGVEFWSFLENPADTRTPEQKLSLANLVYKLIEEYPIVEVIGHRDASPDKNKDGKITPNEWIKQCPCFDVRAEFPISICKTIKK